MIYALIIIGFIVLFFLVILFINVFGDKNKKIKEGMRLESSGRYFDALASYDYLLQNGYSVPELRWKIANLCLKINNIARSLKELSILQQTGNLPANVSFYAVNKLMVECYLKLNREKEAFFGLIELLKTNTDDMWVLLELGKIYAGQGYPGKAIKFFERCLRQSPNDHEVNYLAGKAFLDFGDPERALQYLEKTARLRHFDNGKVNYYLGVIYLSQKKYNHALQHFPQVLKLRPNDNKLLSDSHHYIALCYKEKGLIDEAMVNFEKSQIYAELLPEKSMNKKTLYNEGVLLLKSGQYDKALDKFYKVKMLDYKYKDVERIIKYITAHKKSGEKLPDGLATYIFENPLSNIIKRGLLHAKSKFNINIIEKKAEKYINALTGKDIKQTDNAPSALNAENHAPSHIYSSMSFNSLSSREFKELSRKLVKAIGFMTKSEPKFFNDSEYIDGNAINFQAVPVKDSRRADYLVSVRRYKDMVSELSVSRFIEWLEEANYKNGIFIASQAFSPQAFKVIQSYPNIKFIDKGGLARILGRVT